MKKLVVVFSVVGLFLTGCERDFGIADQVEDALPVTVHIENPSGGQGSGCIISPDGIIFTAKHVTDGEFGEYTVTLNDGRKFKTSTIVEDSKYDVAFLKLDLPEGVVLPYAELANLDNLRVGDAIFICGSPLGKVNFNSVSLGILSSCQRNLDEMKPGGYGYGWKVTFQSDATSLPGNSGGPVFNMKGQVIGVLVAGMDATVNYSVPVAVFKDNVRTIRTWFELSRFEVVEEKPLSSWEESEDKWYEYLETQKCRKN